MHSNGGLRRNRARALVAGVAWALLALAACGGESDGSEGGSGDPLAALEERLVQEQEAEAPNLAVGGASCPADASLEAGSTFECTVTIEGVEAPYAVTVEEGSTEDDISFHFEPAKAIIDVSLVIEFIAGRAGEGAEAECGPDKVIVADVDDTFECSVLVAGQTEIVEMIVQDLDGTVAINN